MKVGVIGAGAWGTALAQVAASGGDVVRLWAREPEVVDAVNRTRENPLYLPRIPLAPTIFATAALADLADCDVLLLVTPAQHLRSVLSDAPVADKALVLCCKGIEAGTGLLMSETTQALYPDTPVAVLSGPTFAHEVGRGLPTAVTLACEDRAVGEAIAARMKRPAFRPYLSDDVIGAEIGGAVKNVIAIGCGVAHGAGLGLNARAALISRGFAEMTRFGLARGARAETLGGLSGLGDLVLTCSSTDSRNFSLGTALGEGRPATELLANRRTVAEGAFTAPVLRDVARAAAIDMPIVEAVCRLLDGSAPVAEVVEALLARPIRDEIVR
ncbi:NAD(P)H-dependent glycerol-3-phosphate dehydrogenase [Sphingobium algorifonticola]|uniref:Glycerol-3-phosphate dehydrogenase [NAD(P)+] n=1 Tax=Sphingobium algorifonticola TaxID=2008318 RepID=A0A437JCM4_9SPHN|nr:NAD(P)H-dependent glycerol-3-phosphate dehydrogenase [Sphingobium algorifonticola]RVT43645.1 NAD(P)-dependent glycerol-3-phosphate dehydrogenase [Sphingobium algorifonticola]